MNSQIPLTVRETSQAGSHPPETDEPKPYAYALCESTEHVNRSDWEFVCSTSDNPFIDLNFVRAVENSMSDPGKYWPVVFYDEAGTPVACTCFSLYEVDGTLLAPSVVQSCVSGVRKLWRRFFTFKILLCGLPVSTSGNQLAAVPDVDWNRLTPSLSDIASQLAQAEKALLISFKEFDPPLVQHLAGLTAHGYRRADSVITYSLQSEFASFDEYYERRSKRTRANMRKVFRKFDEQGLRCVHLSGGEGVDTLYTEDVHRLYEAVYQRAEIKFERLPAAFFQELARHCPERSRFTFLYQGEEIVAFCCALAGPASYDMIYCGVNYELNAQADLYFNLLYRALGDGIASGAPRVNIGASADEFKKRMGCFSTPLSIYVKAVGAIPTRIFGALFGILFPPHEVGSKE
jgi:predicted N-acyltransferase